MNVIGIIPARFASSRFPGKPLVEIDGKPMIQHVYEQSTKVLDKVFVATDDDRIFDAVVEFGGKAIMTSSGHTSGTDRCAEAAHICSTDIDIDVVINIQGDEPFIDPQQIKSLADAFDDHKTQIATLIAPITSSEILFNVNKVKVVKNFKNNALYFSRYPIPFQRDEKEENWMKNHSYFLHIGLYAYRYDTLQALTKMKPSALEKSESLEQLRWLENGKKIRTVLTRHENFGVDTPEDLEHLLKKLKK